MKETKRVLILMVIAFVFLITSNVEAKLFKITKKNYNNIQIGMTKQEVITTIGRKPDKISESDVQGLGKSEMWIYLSAGTKIGVKSKGITVFFDNSRVINKNWTE